MVLSQLWGRKDLKKSTKWLDFTVQTEEKKPRKARERLIEKLENARHPFMSHGTWAVGVRLAASPGCLRYAHVTIFMNGAVWRREDAAQKRRRSGEARMQKRWSLLRWLRGEAKGDKEEGGFQGRSRKSRLGCCGVSVSRTDRFCTRENPFVPNQFSPCKLQQRP